MPENSEITIPKSTSVEFGIGMSEGEGQSESQAKAPKHGPLRYANLVAVYLALAFTASAAVFTWQQIDVARDTAKKGLRAYVGVEIPAPIVLENGGIKIRLQITNAGQTPAYHNQTAVRHMAGYLPINTRDNPVSESCEVITTQQRGSSPFDLQKDGVVEQNFTLPADSPEIAKLRDGERNTLYVFGRLCYRDIYDQEHRWFEYCQSFDWPALRVRTPCVHGERAN